MAKRSELLTELFRSGERKGYKRDEFDSPKFKRAAARAEKDSGDANLARAMRAERSSDVARAKRMGLSDLTALQDRDYLEFQRKPGGYSKQTDDVRKVELRNKLPRTGGMGGKAKGGAVKGYAKGGSSASKRADGCATKGKTKGRFV